MLPDNLCSMERRDQKITLNTEITEKEMAKIATTIITVPEKSVGRVESARQKQHTRHR